MDERQKRDYLEEYQKEKEQGVPFFPDLVFKDVLISLFIFIILIGLAFFLGAPLEERANPADTNYTPRPEWYFLFLFQMLKYFPGSLEVVGVFVIPTLAILVLAALPFLDRGPKRHFSNRKLWVGITLMLMIGITGLTIVAFIEAPPPTESFQGDETAALYAKNCAGCHGPTITVSATTNLHSLIAEGRHEGMPAWSADLTSDEIDALAGFVVSPLGSLLFGENCGACHDAAQLVASNPLELKNALEEGSGYAAHESVEIPDFSVGLTNEERTSILNFLVAPDGQRLYSVNCAPCHGRSVPFSGGEEDLRPLINQGGLHLAMPPWRETLSSEEIDLLAEFVVNPASIPEAQSVYEQFCTSCHGDRVPQGETVEAARDVIASGGAHETMPVWGEILTAEQLDALIAYTLSAVSGTPLALGQDLYAQNCKACHGDFGEGGANPTRPGDIIAPISSAEYLKTRDDLTLQRIISQGQPNFGMAPFGTAFGGPLDDDEVDSIVTFMRFWEADPPVELPPEIASTSVPMSGPEIYSGLCAQCHGTQGEGLLGPSLSDPQFQSGITDQDLFDTISTGHRATAMISWGELLTSDQIAQVVSHIRDLSLAPESPTGGPPSFLADVMPIFEAQCILCHGTQGGWDGTNYNATMTSGDHAPVVLPGDIEGSLLAQKILGTHTEGAIMPPGGKMSDTDIQIILDWIASGTPDN